MTWFYRVFRNPVVFLTVLWTRMRRIGRENIPAEGGAVLVCNHLSMWDMITVACMTRRYVCFVGKSELEKNPLVRFFVRQVKAICVDRGKPDLGAIRRMLAMVKQGELLLIFPEGTRNRHPESQPLLPLQEGTAMVTLHGGLLRLVGRVGHGLVEFAHSGYNLLDDLIRRGSAGCDSYGILRPQGHLRKLVWALQVIGSCAAACTDFI